MSNSSSATLVLGRSVLKCHDAEKATLNIEELLLQAELSAKKHPELALEITLAAADAFLQMLPPGMGGVKDMTCLITRMVRLRDSQIQPDTAPS